jgi:endonuclease/exonuclease/phosphatase family metal-dependent hydrolase
VERRKLRNFNLLISGLTLVFYLLPFISPFSWWPSAFLCLLIPPLLLLNFSLAVFWIYLRSWRFLISALALLIGLRFLSGLIAINRSDQEEDDIKVMSYNVRLFNNFQKSKDRTTSRKMIRWSTDIDADIKCIQEFYHERSSRVFNTMNRFKKSTPYCYFEPYLIQKRLQYGMAIFSKYPFIKSGVVHSEKNWNNKIIFADIKMPNDTIRVYNIHLQSMAIDISSIFQSQNEGFSKLNLSNALKKYKKGVMRRSYQMEKLIAHISKSPYRTIVCGDLNDPPISYSYQSLRSVLNNTFEEGGLGFGYTYDSPLPLRIDNQFCSKNIEVKDFDTVDSIRYSDHFPTFAHYNFKGKTK